MAGQLHTAEPKTARSRRTVDIDAATASALESHHARQREIAERVGEPWNERNLVFVSPDGHPYKPESVSQAFERATARSGLPRLRFHDYADLRVMPISARKSSQCEVIAASGSA